MGRGVLGVILCLFLVWPSAVFAADLGCTDDPNGDCCLPCANDCDCDGILDSSDPDADNDGRCDAATPGSNCKVLVENGVSLPDPNPRHPLICGNADGDEEEQGVGPECDDCSRGNKCFWNYNDIPNATTDADYLACIASIPDTGGQGLTVGQDGFGPAANFNTKDDGAWFGVNDGECKKDTDKDGVPDQFEPSTANDPTMCGDTDQDGCDDCSNQVDGSGALEDFVRDTQPNKIHCLAQDPSSGANCLVFRNDGPDADNDGFCDAGDNDRDGDGGLNETDPFPDDPSACGDIVDEDGTVDNDLCDDCTNGPFFQAGSGRENDTLLTSDGNFCKDHDKEGANGEGDGHACRQSSGCVDGMDCRDRPSLCLDNCPDTVNPDQADSNGNGIGDACEPNAKTGEVPLYGCSNYRGWGFGLLLFVVAASGRKRKTLSAN